MHSRTINEILDYEITPHIAGYGVKKLFHRVSVKCQVCANKLSCSCNLNQMRKIGISCNIEHIDLRDEGGLLWPSKIVAMLTGAIIKLFEWILASNNLMNYYCTSCSSSCAGLLVLKSIVNDILSNLPVLNVWKGEYRWCHSCPKEY